MHHSGIVLDKAHRLSFEDKGFFIQESVFSQTLIQDALSGVMAVLDGVYDTGVEPLYTVDLNCPYSVNRAGQIHYSNTAIFRLLQSPAIGHCIAMISGAQRVKMWGSQLYYKPPQQNAFSQIGCHRDSQHLPCIENNAFTVWIPLTEITEQSGTLTYLAGSHKSRDQFQPVGAQDPDIDSQLASIKSNLSEQYTKEFEVRIKPGGFAVHHQDTIHASLCNRSVHPRVALAVSIVTDKTTYDRNKDEYGVLDIIDYSEFCHEYSLVALNT